MDTKITKGCTDSDSYLRRCSCFERARDGFGAILDLLRIGRSDKILIPGYIGWSPREGSGVFDPIVERALTPIFYHLDKLLTICEKDISEKIATSGAKVLLLIHYFGFPDINAQKYAKLAHEKGIIVIEDCAHAMFTDRVYGSCGRYGDFTIYALHKMLPVSVGGMLIARNGFPMPAGEMHLNFNVFEYDCFMISQKRRANYMALDRALRNLSELVVPLYPEVPEYVVPQSYPIVIPYSDRDRIYEYMNSRGWGVVSLYHTMVKAISNDGFPQENMLSHMIMNLPVHQDINATLYPAMISDLLEAAELLKRE